MFETVKVVGDLEYYYNSDKKLVSRYRDNTKDYRVEELQPKIKEQLAKARAMYRYPTKAFIDTVILYQKEAPVKAINYIKYKLLGTANYMDVFGVEIEDLVNSRKIEELEKELISIRGLCEQILQKL